MKKFITFCVMAFAMILLMSASGCDNEPTMDQIEGAKQEASLKEASAEIGMPSIPNFQEKKTLKWVLELRDNTEILNYAYAFSEQTGKFSYIGRCIGFPIPYATQYTNPQKAVYHNSYGYTVLPQPDPNGLFSPASADGTWILLVDPKTKAVHPMYMEPKVSVIPFPLPDEVCSVNVKQ